MRAIGSDKATHICTCGIDDVIGISEMGVRGSSSHDQSYCLAINVKGGRQEEEADRVGLTALRL